jgi:C-terminal processing protease CtpA/Prc
MHDSGRAITIGHTTAGSSGTPVRLEAAGFEFQVSRWREYRADGSLIEGHGVPADIVVRPTIAGIAGGVDTVLAVALDYLRSR